MTALVLSFLVATLAAQPAAFRAEIDEVASHDTIVLADGRLLRLQGLSLPTAAVRPAAFEARLLRFLKQSLEKKSVWVFPESENAPGDVVSLTAVVRTAAAGTSVNAEALSRGLALLSCRTPTVRELDHLAAAAMSAQVSERGWFDPRPGRLKHLPYLNGAVLGLHSQDPKEDYHRQLDELAAAGFEHVCLLFSSFLDNARAIEIRRDHVRCVRDNRLLATIRYAKRKGFSVMLLPIVLLLESGEDDWRGTLRPADPGAFWLSYDEFLCHYLDIAEFGGADIFSIGSELGSLESQTEIWNRLIAHARGRFRGFLSYSANWDHVHVPRFFGKIDLVGMTAYFSLSDKRDPSPEELVAGWREIAGRLQRSVGMLGKPVIFTELGYASQDGININPWDYVSNEDEIDLDEQAACFRAFNTVVPSMTFLRGAYFYDYFERGGPDDHSYSPRGKPAFEEWKRWARFTPGG